MTWPGLLGLPLRLLGLPLRLLGLPLGLLLFAVIALCIGRTRPHGYRKQGKRRRDTGDQTNTAGEGISVSHGIFPVAGAFDRASCCPRYQGIPGNVAKRQILSVKDAQEDKIPARGESLPFAGGQLADQSGKAGYLRKARYFSFHSRNREALVSVGSARFSCWQAAIIRSK